MSFIKYSVVIPTFNEEACLSVTLEALKIAIGLRDDIEVILVDNYSTDNSVRLAQQFGARILQSHSNISASRNLGARATVGKYIYFLDADITVPPQIFTVLDRFVAEARSDVLGFLDLAPENAPWFAYTWSRRILTRRGEYTEVDWLPGRNIFVSRAYFDRVNGFDASLLTSEDKDFVVRLRKAGAKVVSDPQLVLTHLGFERTWKQWCQKEFWRQRSHLTLLQSQGLSCRLLRFPALAMYHVVLMCASVALLLSYPALGLLCMIFWITPSVLQTLFFPATRRSVRSFGQFWLLYFLRYHIAAMALMYEFFTICRERLR
ncbi:glycosyltransferase [Desulfogranum japonicum]|uniref:glycosyltransferase n=1 Tax=Desulfogranum japonicum TaxID=231447 RepID=UPI0003F8D21D|nr:glycosyltransferase [Desulfogranum japonicum]